MTVDLDLLPKIERAGPKAAQPYLVRFVGGTRRFLRRDSAVRAIARVQAAADPRVKAAYEAYYKVIREVTEEWEQIVREDPGNV